MRRWVKYIAIAKLLWLVCTVGLVWAAERAVQSPQSVPIGHWGWTLVLSIWGGATMLLQKFARGDETERWQLVIASSILSSTLAGLLVYMACVAVKHESMWVWVGVTIAGYGGSRTLDAIFARFEKQIGEAKP